MQWLRLVCLAALIASAADAGAQLSGHVAVMSDYVFRGESLTEGRPALQAGINYDHASGLYLGALASNVQIEPNDAGVGGQVYAGYARALGNRAGWDAGLVAYLFPRPSSGPGYDYVEAYVGASIDSFSGRLFFSQDYFGTGAQSVYAQLDASFRIDAHLVLLGHVGYLLEHSAAADPAFYQPGSALDLKAGVSIDVRGFNLEISVTGTTAPTYACPAASGHCGTTAVVSLSKRF